MYKIFRNKEIKKIRKQLRLRQRDFAVLMNVKYQTVRLWESRVRRRFKPRQYVQDMLNELVVDGSPEDRMSKLSGHLDRLGLRQRRW